MEERRLPLKKGLWPLEFVDVQEVIPSIVPALHYAHKTNFLERPAHGYHAQRILLTREAANALSHVSKSASNAGYRLVVYDAYRPRKAVLDFMHWGQCGEKNSSIKKLYYPLFSRGELFEKGYIASHSSHSRGSTVDLTLIKEENVSGFNPHRWHEETYVLRDGRHITYLMDGTLDMGGHFDLFDPSSHPGESLVSDVSQKNRNVLAELMMQAGFLPFEQEWWHFTLADEPFSDTFFDFDVQ